MNRADIVIAARHRMNAEYLAHVKLRKGTGTGQEGDACVIQEERRVLQLVATEAGALELAAEYDPSTDACPPCTSPTCHGLIIPVQDARADWRQECVALLPLLVGSAGSAALERRRQVRLLDWSVREALPACMEVQAEQLKGADEALSTRLRQHAEELRALAPIIDDATWDRARALLGRVDLDLALALALDLALDLALARALARARALALALARAVARAVDLARALARDLALDLARALAVAPTSALPSPVAILRELLEMQEQP